MGREREREREIDTQKSECLEELKIFEIILSDLRVSLKKIEREREREIPRDLSVSKS